MDDKLLHQPASKSDRAYHRPISIVVETIEPLPYERDLPNQTQMTVNHRFSRAKAEEMILFLQKALAHEHVDFIAVTITGPTP